MAKRKSSHPTACPAEHIRALIEWMSAGIYEKDLIVAAALLSAIAGENIFLLGPPGTAKSLVASRLKMVFKDARSFDYLMSRFSTPDEIFGPISISNLKNEDRYFRLTDGYLPDADIVFLDEIWKAGPSIQNTLLTAINEHIFHNGGKTVSIPMKVLIAASNELPAKDEGLEALWDRFLMRMVSNPIRSEADFFRMLSTDSTVTEPLDNELLLTDELYADWQAKSRSIALGPHTAKAIIALRRFLEEKEKEDGNALRFYVSDRRWRKAFRLMQTSAFLNGRTATDMSDYLLLIHCVWNDVEALPTVIEAVTSGIADTFLKQLEKTDRSIRQVITPHGQPVEKRENTANKFIEYDYFYYRIDNYIDGQAYFAKLDYGSLGASPIDGISYYDKMMQKHIIHAAGKNKSQDLKNLNGGKVKKVRIERWINGVIIDGIPYPFAKHESDDADAPFITRANTILTGFEEICRSWEEYKMTLDSCRDNMFVSKADYSLLDKAKALVEEQIKIIRIKINNLKALT